MKHAGRLAFIILLLLLFIPASQAEETEFYTAGPLEVNLSYTSDRLFSAYARSELYGRPLTAALAARRSLTEREKAVYDFVAEKVAQVAAGERLSTEIYCTMDGIPDYLTEEDIGIPFYNAEGELNKNAVISAVAAYFEYDSNRVFAALFRDHPYEFYWACNHEDCLVASPYSHMTLIRVQDGEGGEFLAITVLDTFGFSYPVDELYRGESLYRADPDMTGAVSAAVANAEALVRAGEGMSDHARLRYYGQQLAEQSPYNDEAASMGIYYGNSAPWQLIWALDGDPATKVVCEGYSEAFQYLCDLTEFLDPEIEVLCVQGYLNKPSAGHEWNIVHMRGGNYLVDVTNAYFGQYSDIYFLSAAESGNAEEGYRVFSNLYVYRDAAFPEPVPELELTFTSYTDPEYSEAAITLSPGDELPLSLNGVNASALMTRDTSFGVRVSDPSVLSCDGEMLTALSSGTAKVTLAGVRDVTVLTVTVEEMPVFSLPESLSYLGAEALSGTGARRVVLPAALTEAEQDAFSGFDAGVQLVLSSPEQVSLLPETIASPLFCRDAETAAAVTGSGREFLFLK